MRRYQPQATRRLLIVDWTGRFAESHDPPLDPEADAMQPALDQALEHSAASL